MSYWKRRNTAQTYYCYVAYLILLLLSQFAVADTVQELSIAGQTAMSAGDYRKAIEIFNQLLNQPNNEYSREAQELVGDARAGAGETDKAIIEYKVYLDLYPNDANAERVNSKLTALLNKRIAKETPVILDKTEIHTHSEKGSVSQYYYGGISQRASGNSVDVSSLITSINVTLQKRDNSVEQKIVIKDTQYHNMTNNQVDKNSLIAAYYDYRDLEQNYSIKLGRQPGNLYGIFGRYDGISATVGLLPRWKAIGAVGWIDSGSHPSTTTDRHFYSGGIEYTSEPGDVQWSTTGYVNQQIADGVIERRAVGGEYRWYNNRNSSVYAVVDYDTLYREFNTVMLQANTDLYGYHIDTLVEKRRAPFLSGDTAISSIVGARSVGDIWRILGNNMYATVNDLSYDVYTSMIGVSKQINKQWQVSNYLRMTNNSSTIGTALIAPQASSDVYSYSFQTLGTGIWFSNDSFLMAVSHSTGTNFNSTSVTVAESVTRDRMRYDGSFRITQSNSDYYQITPSIRIGYKLDDKATIEAQVNVDYNQSPYTTTWSESIFTGYRLDF